MDDHQGVELRHLRYFVAVAEEGTMTEAARVLRPDHPLAEHAALSWADLADQELLWFPAEANPRFSEDVLAHLAGHGWTPRLRIADAHSQALYCHHLRTSENLVGLRGRKSITADAGMAWRPLASDPPRRRFVLAAPRGSSRAGAGLPTRRQPDGR